MAMEVGIRQEVCNNLTAKWSSPENWWRFNIYLLPCHFYKILIVKCVGCRDVCLEVSRRRGMERTLVQISVIVANIQTKYIMNWHNKPKMSFRRQSFEGRSGEGFLTSGAHVRVSRS